MDQTYHATDQEKTTDHDHRTDRINALRKRLEYVPSSEFTVGELIVVLRIMDEKIFTAKGKWQDPHEEDLKRIERKLDDLMSGP